MKVYLVRHAQRDYGENFDKLLTTGIWQAKKLGPFFRNKKINIVYCSPQKRAKDTLKEIIPYLKGNTRIKITQRVRQQSAPEEVGESVAKRLGIKNETDKEATERVRKFISFLLKEDSDKTVLVVTHKMFTKFFLSILLNKHKDDFKIKSGSISTLDISKGGKVIRSSIGKINYSEKESRLIGSAYYLAREAYSGQKGLDGRLYIDSAAKAARELALEGQDYDVISARMLYSAVKDSKITLMTIRTKLDKKTAFTLEKMINSKLRLK